MPLDDWTNYVDGTDASDMSEDVLRELLRQAEMRQEAIFRAALGMDNRASILAGGLAAAAGALTAAAASLGAHDPTVTRLLLVTAVFVGVGAGLCAYACRPQRFRFPGTPPNDWTREVSYLRDNTLREILHGHVARLQDWMKDNDERQRANGRVLMAGMACAASGPLLVSLTALLFGWL